MTAGDDSAFERGIAMRRKVLGDAHVDRSTGNVSEFARPVRETDADG
jgi:4-carboxymuconolactone decarboxylase